MPESLAIPELGILNGVTGPDWLRRAIHDLARFDIIEIPGDEHHPRILEYHSHTNLKATQDEVAWCSAAVCCWLEESGFQSTRSAAARSFEKYGETLEVPLPGAIAVYWRGRTPQGWQGHVGLWLARASRTHDLIVGGNQSNTVGLQTYPTRRLLCWKWPCHDMRKGEPE